MFFHGQHRDLQLVINKIEKFSGRSAVIHFHLEKTLYKSFYNSGSNLLGTVSLISSNLPHKDGNARFTIVPLKPLSGQ